MRRERDSTLILLVVNVWYIRFKPGQSEVGENSPEKIEGYTEYREKDCPVSVEEPEALENT